MSTRLRRRSDVVRHQRKIPTEYDAINLDDGVQDHMHEGKIFTCTCVSDNTDGPEWIQRLTSLGHTVNPHAQDLLKSVSFIPSHNVTYQVIIVRPTIVDECIWYEPKIRRRLKAMLGVITPPPELVCLLRNKIAKADMAAMGMRNIIVMHTPIEDSKGTKRILELFEPGENMAGGLYADKSDPAYKFGRTHGLAFLTRSRIPSK